VAPRQKSQSPFEALRELRDKLPPNRSDQPDPSPEPEPEQVDHDDKRLDEAEEAQAFARAMDGVTPLELPPRVPVKREVGRPRTIDEDEAVREHLRNLVNGDVPFDISDSGEHIEGAAQGLDRRILKRLRKGELAVQAYVDLHGLHREEASAEVRKFIKRSHEKGLRCVLVVHGRGLGSKDGIPVLKEKLKAWLTRGATGSRVLAFSSARPWDGGTGAAYVLLRR